MDEGRSRDGGPLGGNCKCQNPRQFVLFSAPASLAFKRMGGHVCNADTLVDVDLAKSRVPAAADDPFNRYRRLVGVIAGGVLLVTVFAAVYHAEVVAHRVGEPFGTLILALAVTVIETALIVSVMIAAPAEKAGLARDTVFAAVMIVCNGIVGACLLWGGVRHHEQGFQAQGASAALAVLVALTSLTMVLPNLAAQELGPLYNKPHSSSPALYRWCCISRSSSSRRCATATIFCRFWVQTRRNMYRRRTTGLLP